MNKIIEVQAKELLDSSTEQFLSLKKEEFFGFAKKTVEAYLETGRILCEVNEKLASTDRRTNRWSTWLEEIGVPGRSAREIMQVYRKYGSVGAVTAVTSSTILVALSSPSADPELVSEVESRIQSGEKLTVATVKDILKREIPSVEPTQELKDLWAEQARLKPIVENQTKQQVFEAIQESWKERDILEQAFKSNLANLKLANQLLAANGLQTFEVVEVSEELF